MYWLREGGRGSAPGGSSGVGWGISGGCSVCATPGPLYPHWLSPSPACLSCRAIGLPSGIILFLLAKREVDKNRLEQLKIRRTMVEANQGEYETERYKRVVRGA